MAMVVNRPDGLPASPRTLISLYSDYLWKRLRTLLPSPSFFRRARSRRRRPSLPLPLSPASLEAFVDKSEASRVVNVLEDVLEHIFLDLHIIQKNLLFWHSRAEGSNARKTYFLIFERGPKAFFGGSVRLIRECITEGHGLKNTCNSASAYIYERITVLTSLRYYLATFLAQVYVEIDKFGEELVKDPENSLPKLLVTIHGLFSDLEESIANFHATHQGGLAIDDNCSVPVLFDKLPTANQEGSQWTESEIGDATNLIYENLQKLDSYLNLMVAKNRKPRKLTLHWLRYTFGIVGVSVCSFWLLKHSSVMGSSDINNWIREAKESTYSFWNDHVEQPLLSIRDELFETFRKRHKSVIELEEVHLTSKSLHRMLLAFSEQTKGKVPEDASDQEMLEIVMGRYEEELTHPIKSLLGGELARALLIQIQKLKLDIETAMLELNQILRANEINFAVLAALPAFFVSIVLIMGVRAWLKKDTRAEGRGRVARIQRRLLIVEVERGIMQFQTCMDQKRVKDAECMFGLVLYHLDRLYRAVERHAQTTGEWRCLREDLMDLAKPGFQSAYKLAITSRMERVYDCLLPSSTRQ